MIRVFASIAACSLVLSTHALASGPANIDGLTGRLENARCIGAFVLKRRVFEKFGESGKCQDSADTEAMVACLKTELPKIADFRSDAVFELRAIADQTDFDASILVGGTQAFHSLRHGFHGDSDNGAVLGFYRVGTEGGSDPYQIDFAPLNDDGTRAPIAFVPVKRTLLPDLIYLFVDGCSLRWERR